MILMLILAIAAGILLAWAIRGLLHYLPWIIAIIIIVWLIGPYIPEPPKTSAAKATAAQQDRGGLVVGTWKLPTVEGLRR